MIPSAIECVPGTAAGRAAEPAALANFDRIAGIYRWMELLTFGPWLERCRCAFLPRFTGFRSGVVLGDGDGRFTARLLDANPDLVLDAVDLSPAMLNALTRRAGPHAGRVHACLADARLWLPACRQYDLIGTHFFLDCLTTDEVRRLAKTVHCALNDGAVWVVSEFAVPQSRFGRFVARPLVAILYRVFGWLTGLGIRSLPDHATALQEEGFALECRRAFLGGLLVSELWKTAP